MGDPDGDIRAHEDVGGSSTETDHYVSEIVDGDTGEVEGEVRIGSRPADRPALYYLVGYLIDLVPLDRGLAIDVHRVNRPQTGMWTSGNLLTDDVAGEVSAVGVDVGLFFGLVDVGWSVAWSDRDDRVSLVEHWVRGGAGDAGFLQHPQPLELTAEDSQGKPAVVLIEDGLRTPPDSNGKAAVIGYVLEESPPGD